MNEKALLLAVFAQVEREKAVSIPQLARLLGEPEDAVAAAVEKLVFAYDNVSIYLDLQDSYARLADQGTTRILRLTPEETGVLIDALESQGIPPESDLVRKLVQAKGLFEEVPSSQARTVSLNADGGLAELVAASCEDEAHHLLRIVYQGEGAAQAAERIVEPYMMSSETGNIALEAYCRTAGGWRTFRLSRVKDAQMLSETFEPRPMPQAPQRTRFDDVPRARVLLQQGVELPSWPGLRKRSPRADGSMEVSVPWLGGVWLPKRVAALGPKAQALEPPEFVDAVRAYARELLAAL